MRDVYISPVKAVLHCLHDETVDFIFCTMEDCVPSPTPPNALLLRFMDVTDPAHPLAFRAEQAAKIAAFLRRPDARPEVFVCCDSGESRSAAIAAAILLSQGSSDAPIWDSAEYHPNPLVFQRMCAALGVAVTEAALKDRQKRSDAAFHTALNR